MSVAYASLYLPFYSVRCVVAFRSVSVSVSTVPPLPVSVPLPLLKGYEPRASLKSPKKKSSSIFFLSSIIFSLLALANYDGPDYLTRS